MNNNDYKGPGKRGHIVAHDASWDAQTGKHLLRTQNVSEQNPNFVSRTQNWCPQQMLHARANGKTFVSATMCPQQCVLVCQGLKVLMSWHYIGLIVAPWKFDALKTSIFALKTSDFCWEAISRQPSTKAFY